MSGTAQRTVLLVCVLALLCMSGLIAMLIVDVERWDRAFLLLAALPLLVGGWSVARARVRRGTAVIAAEAE